MCIHIQYAVGCRRVLGCLNGDKCSQLCFACCLSRGSRQISTTYQGFGCRGASAGERDVVTLCLRLLERIAGASASSMLCGDAVAREIRAARRIDAGGVVASKGEALVEEVVETAMATIRHPLGLLGGDCVWCGGQRA